MFNLGDKVYRAIDPDYTYSSEYAIECTITGIETLEHGESSAFQRHITRYRVSYDTIDTPQFIEAEYIFKTKKEAKEKVKNIVAKRVTKMKNKLQVYKDLGFDLETSELEYKKVINDILEDAWYLARTHNDDYPEYEKKFKEYYEKYKI
jgi:hypothetical protein